jgi:hypothetical protein
VSGRDLDDLEELVDQATAAPGDRLAGLQAAHDALREALADDDAQAPGR